MTVVTKSGVERACDVMGSQAALAKALDVTPQAVGLWVSQGWVPNKRVPDVARLTNVPKSKLRDPSLND